MLEYVIAYIIYANVMAKFSLKNTLKFSKLYINYGLN